MSAVRKPRPAAMPTAAIIDNSATAAPAGAAAFLRVTSSAKGMAWRERLAPGGHGHATAISQRHGLPELLGRVLAARDVGLDAVPVFLEPTLKALMPDPSSLQDMEKAAERLADAIVAKTRIAIFGDYDVDGACSSALFARFLEHHGVATRIYIPDRIFEGYGPNVAAIEGLIKDGAGLIVTVDCGTTSFQPLAAARKLNTDVIVVDHHQADPQLPDVHAVVNPNRQDDLSGLGYLCAAGVVFMLLVAITRVLRRRGVYKAGLAEPSLIDLLDLVALATVCDVVPLKALNRAFVTQGLKVMRQRRNPGLKALLDVAALKEPPNTYALGYVIGPRINAGGRIGDAALGARLLSTEDTMETARIAALLDKLNRERKMIEKSMLDEALAEADRRVTDNPDLAILILGSEAWHKGIVGLVASRLVERFHRPACVLSWEAGHEGTGSLRSIAGVDIGAAVRGAVADGILIKGGGHAMAAGLTVSRDKLEALSAYLGTKLQRSANMARSAAALDIDGVLMPSAVTHDLIDLLERAGPFGQGNPQPRFALADTRVRFAKLVGEAHVRCSLEAADGSRLEAVAFRAAGQPLGDLLLDTGGMPIHITGQLRRDNWGGREKIELLIDDAADPRKQG